VEISRNLAFLTNDGFADLEMKAAEVGRLLNGLITRLRRDIEESETRRPKT
jgi:hypothetical protein